MGRLHQRTMSEMSFAELGLFEKVELDFGDDVEQGMTTEPPTKSRRTLAIIYMLFMAEAIMASGLQPQLQMLTDSGGVCGDFSASYVRSILDYSYAFGGVAGMFWGWLSDRIGRRPVALTGMGGMLLCCVSMGFATNLVSCALLRFVAGLVSSSTAVVSLTMIGDLSPSTSDRAVTVSRLPLVGLCGSVGPLVQGMVTRSLTAYGAVWARYPLLSSQITCGLLVLAIAVVVCLFLDETLPILADHERSLSPMESERSAFLGPAASETPSIAIVDSTLPDPISLRQMLRAPSLIILLSSFSLLSLHSSTFDTLLPHLGHSPTHHGGMGIPCSILDVVTLCVRAVAAMLVLTTIPRLARNLGALRPYQIFSICFPAIYIVTPLFAYVASSSPMATAISSGASLLFKNTLFSTARVLVALLVLNASPDVFSSGTIVGLMQTATVFKALAVAVTGASFYFSPEVTVATTNLALWSVLVSVSLAGACLAWFVRDRPTVNQDFPAEILRWEMCFDAGAEAAGSMKAG